MRPNEAVAPPPRSQLVTALAWVVILASLLLSAISFVSLLMILVGSHGTASTDVLGFLAVVVAPPATLVSGVGLLRRKRWAWLYLVVLVSIILAANVYDSLMASREPSHYVSPEGVPTTVLPTDPNMFQPIIAACMVMLALLLSRRVRLELGVGSEAVHRADASSTQASSPRAAAPAALSGADRDGPVGHAGKWRDGSAFSTRLASLLAVTILLVVAGGMAWIVNEGLTTGDTQLPSKLASQRRSVSRLHEPAAFWIAIATYAGVGLGAVGLLGWGIAAARQKHSHASRFPDEFT